MATIGLHNLLFSNVFESGSATAEAVGADPKIAGEGKQVLPQAADFSTLIQSFLAQGALESVDSEASAPVKSPEVVETEQFLTQLFGREVEVTPLGKAEGFEFFQISIGKEVSSKQPLEPAGPSESPEFAPELETGSIAGEFLSLLFAPVDPQESDSSEESEVADRVDAFLFVGKGPLQQIDEPAESGLSEGETPHRIPSVPVFVFLFLGQQPTLPEGGEAPSEDPRETPIVRAFQTRVPQSDYGEGSSGSPPLSLTVFTVPVAEDSIEVKQPGTTVKVPAETLAPEGTPQEGVKPKTEPNPELKIGTQQEAQTKPAAVAADGSPLSASHPEVTEDSKPAVLEARNEEPVIPFKDVKNERVSVPAPPPESDRSGRSVEVLDRDGAVDKPRKSEVEFQPRFVEALERAIEKVVAPSLGDRSPRSPEIKPATPLPQQTPLADPVASAPFKSTRIPEVTLAEIPNTPVPESGVGGSTPGLVSIEPPPAEAPEVRVIQEATEKPLPSPEPVVEVKPKTAIQLEDPLPQTTQVDPNEFEGETQKNPAIKREATPVKVEVLAGDLAKKLEALSGKILETRSFVAPVAKPVDRPIDAYSKADGWKIENPTGTKPALAIENPEPLVPAKSPDSARPSGETRNPSLPTHREGIEVPKEIVTKETGPKQPVTTVIAKAEKPTAIEVDELNSDPSPKPLEGERPKEVQQNRFQFGRTHEPRPTRTGTMETPRPAGKPVSESVVVESNGQHTPKMEFDGVTETEPVDRPESKSVKRDTEFVTQANADTRPRPISSIVGTSSPLSALMREPVPTLNSNLAESGVATAAALEPKTAPIRETQSPLMQGLPQAPVEESEVLSQISRNIQSRSVTQGSEMRIRLVPENLGEIHLKITVREGQVIAEIRASSETTREILQRSVSQIQSLLSETGLGMEKAIVRTGSFGSDLQGNQTLQRDGAQQQQDAKDGRREHSDDSQGDRSQGREDSRKNPRRRAWERFV